MKNANNKIEDGISKTRLDHFDSEIKIKSFDAAPGILFQGDTVGVTIMIENTANNDQKIWLSFQLQDPVGAWLSIEQKILKIPQKQTIKLSLEGMIPVDIMSGEYSIVVCMWDKMPGSSAKKLAHAQLDNSLRIYRERETFKTWPQRNWLAREGKLGRSSIQSDNVILKNCRLNLMLPAKTLNGAEIKKAEKVHYGSYEIRMKIPARATSITGFFLYDQPDYEQEIDIEIFNQSEAIILFTTYARGRQTQTIQQVLPFDPTQAFHRYRIDYLPERVSFFIDDIPIQTWVEGLPDTPMYLMVNSWYPNWLKGLSTAEDNFVVIDWILQ